MHYGCKSLCNKIIALNDGFIARNIRACTKRAAFEHSEIIFGNKRPMNMAFYPVKVMGHFSVDTRVPT